MRLYEVTVEVTTYLVCEDEPDRYDAEQAAEAEVRDNGLHGAIDWREVKLLNEIPIGSRDTMPHSDIDDDNLTLAEWMERIHHVEEEI